MAITKRCVTHVGELDIALRARVHEKVTVGGMELGGGYDFSQLLHVHRFDVDDIWEHPVRGDRGREGESTH